MTAGGLEDGDYMLGEFPVVVANGTARLKSTGNLAGSILKLKDGLKNVVEWGIANPHEAVMMASFNPANLFTSMMFVVKSVKVMTLTLSC